MKVNVKTSIKYIIILGISFITIIMAYFIYQKRRQHYELITRIEDIKKIYYAYTNVSISNKQIGIDDLLVYIKEKNMKLSYPSRRDMQQPCHRIVCQYKDSDTNIEALPRQIIIEETENIKDNNVIRVYADGSVRIEKRGR